MKTKSYVDAEQNPVKVVVVNGYVAYRFKGSNDKVYVNTALKEGKHYTLDMDRLELVSKKSI